MGSQMLRCAQHDTTGFGRYSSLSALTACSPIPLNLLKVIIGPRRLFPYIGRRGRLIAPTADLSRPRRLFPYPD
jgi:hypothetical protein